MLPLLAALWLGFAPPGPAGSGQPTEAAASDAKARARAIVFLIGPCDAQRGCPAQAERVVAAIRAQIADLDARIEVAPLPASAQLGSRLAAARNHATTHQAIGVFWLDVDDDGDLLLHLVDPQGERMLVRRVEPSPESDTAAIQTVAVIARGFTSALLEGRSIGLYRVEVGPAAEDDERPPLSDELEPFSDTRRAGRLRIGAAYYGAHVAPQGDWIWQSGVATSLAWQWRVGVYAGVGYDATQRFHTVTASARAMNTVTTQVRRNPASAIVGYQHRWPRQRLALDGELRLTVDPHTVRSDDALDGSIVSEDAVAVFVLLSPRAALHLRPVRYFSVHLTLGAEVVLRGEEFRVDFFDEADDHALLDSKVYLSPALFRPLAVAGVTFYF